MTSGQTKTFLEKCPLDTQGQMEMQCTVPHLVKTKIVMLTVKLGGRGVMIWAVQRAVHKQIPPNLNEKKFIIM